MKEQGVFVSQSALNVDNNCDNNDNGETIIRRGGSGSDPGPGSIISFSQSLLSWQELEMAFNDCVIISFSSDGDEGDDDDDIVYGSCRCWPLRPDEHIANEDDDGKVV